MRSMISLNTQQQLLRFLLVGVLNTCIGYSLYALFIYFNFNYSLAALLAMVIGVLFNFQTIGTFVFKNKDHRHWQRFIGVYSFTYLLNISLITLLRLFITNPYLAGFFALIPVALVTFVLNKLLVFNRVAQ